MPSINIVKPFLLRRADGTEQFFRVGVHDVSDADADHWYVKQHSDKPPERAPEPEYDLGKTRKVNVVKPFTLSRDDGTRSHYRPGEQDMPEVDADHWYAQQHLEGAPEPVYPVGTPQYAEQQARLAAEQRQTRAVKDQQVHQAAEAARAASPEEEHEEDEPETDEDRRANRRRKKRQRTGEAVPEAQDAIESQTENLPHENQ